MPTEDATVYYQINYTLTDVPDDLRLLPRPVAALEPAAVPGRSTPWSTGSQGTGHYVGTYLAWGVNNNGWWGEGEIKFYLDGDQEFPTICGTGTEDYFGGAWNFDVPGPGLHAVLDAVPGAARRCSARTASTDPAAVRDVPLARHGPDPLRVRPAGHDPGARLALRPALPAAPGRHRLDRVLLPASRPPRPARPCRARTAWKSSDFAPNIAIAERLTHPWGLAQVRSL